MPGFDWQRVAGGTTRRPGWSGVFLSWEDTKLNRQLFPPVIERWLWANARPLIMSEKLKILFQGHVILSVVPWYSGDWCKLSPVIDN